MAMNKRRVLLANLVLSIVSTVLALGIAEAVTRWLSPEYTRGLYQVAHDGLRLVAHSKGVYKSSEYEFTVTSNRFGRRDWEWSTSVFDDPCGIVFVGDSFVFGYGVKDGETVPDLIETLLEHEQGNRKREVFNFGLGGTFPEYREAARDAINLGIRARTILVGVFIGNDFTELPVYVRAAQGAAASERSWRVPTLDRSALYRLVKARLGGSAAITGLLFKAGRWLGRDIYPTSAGYIFLRHWTNDQESLFYSFLAQGVEIDRLAEAYGRRVTFVIFPNKIQVENSSDLTSDVYDADLPNRRMLAFCAEHGLSCLDLLPPLRDAYAASKDGLYFPIDRHLNASGNKIAAQHVVEFLRLKDQVCEP